MDTLLEARPNSLRKKSPTSHAGKIPPYSHEAEQSVLGGLMLDNESWDKVSERISAVDFYRPEHRTVFKAIADMARDGKPFDIVTVTEHLKACDKLEAAGGEFYVYELANNIPSVANVIHYADIIRERSVLRQLIHISQEIAHDAFNPEGMAVSELLDRAEAKVFAIAEQTGSDDGPEPIKNWLTKSVERIDELYHSDELITGLSTGFSDFDEMTSGLQRADLVIVAGRPSMGKTTFAMNLVEYAAISKDKPVLVFSMEMPGEQLATRMISSLGRINQQNLRTGKLSDEDWPRLTSAVSMLSEAKLFIDDSPGLSPGELRARARRLAREHGEIGLIMIDYLQLMQVPGSNTDNRTAEISEISRSLKMLAKEMNAPVIALSQLNRSLEQRADKRPVMSDLRESGAIEQDADLICFIYRDEVYFPDTPDKGVAEIIIAKQRNGPIGKCRLAFLGQFTRFEDLVKHDYSGGINIDA